MLIYADRCAKRLTVNVKALRFALEKNKQTNKQTYVPITINLTKIEITFDNSNPKWQNNTL